MRTVPRRRRQQSARSVSRRRSRRTRRSLLLVFALVFAPVAARTARAACVEFATPPAISNAAAGAFAVAAADVDRDGDLDVLSASQSDHEIAWYQNSAGDGSAWLRITISTTATGALDVIAADLDGDGDEDVISAAFTADEIVWYENDGSPAVGDWTARVVSGVANGAYAVVTGDLDGDGDLDLASALLSDGKIAWYENLDPDGGGPLQADGTSWTLHTVGTLPGARSVAIGDLDGDGELDLVATTESLGSVVWYENDGSPATDPWAARTIGAALTAMEVALADVDDDGALDVLVAASGDDALSWFENDGTPLDGGWFENTIATGADQALGLAAADVDGDGDLDALSASGTDDKVAWIENRAGDGSFWSVHTVTLGADLAASVVAGDVDGDGDLDLLSASSNDNEIAWFRNERLHDEALLPAFATISDLFESPYSVHAADVDGDGDLDVVASFFGYDTVAWLENLALNGDASSWTAHVLLTSPFPAYAVVPADVDSDGDVDLLSTQVGDDGVTWFENGGGGASWSRQTISGLDLASSIAGGDIDGDGDVDALTGASDGNLVWHENTAATGDGSTWTRHLIASATTTAPYSGSLADLDGDGDLDVLAAIASFYVPDLVLWYENAAPSGDGSTWSIHTVVALAGAFSVTAGDLDRDGDLDVVAAALGAPGAIAWYANDGDGAGWAPRTLLATSTGFAAVVAADLDGDGDLDVLATNDYAGAVVWFDNRGGGATWSAQTLSTTLLGAAGVAAADLDGDGDLDPFAAAIDLGAIAWFPNLGTGIHDDGFDSDANTACWSSSVP